MSDGDNATPGLPSRPGPPDAGGDNRWLTRSPRPSPAAAPWERSGSPESEDVDKARQTGNHTDGVTVAARIAKVHGNPSVPEELRRPRPEPEVEPPGSPTEVFASVSEPPPRYSPALDPDSVDTDVIPIASVQPSELPDL